MSQIDNMIVTDINFATSGDNTLLAAVTATNLRVWQIFIVASAAVNIIFKHNSTAFNASAIPLTAAGSAIVLDHSGQAWFSTLPGEAFIINLSGNVQVSGQVYWTKG